jgi:hypothetical protein
MVRTARKWCIDENKDNKKLAQRKSEFADTQIAFASITEGKPACG